MDDPEAAAGARISSYEDDFPNDYHQIQNIENEAQIQDNENVSSGFDMVEDDPQPVTPGVANIYYDPDELDANTVMYREPSPEMADPEPEPPYVPPYVEPVTNLDDPEDEPVPVHGGGYEQLENADHPDVRQSGYEPVTVEHSGVDQYTENGYRNSLPPPPTPLTSPPELEDAYSASYTEPARDSEYRESYVSAQAPEEQLTVLYDGTADVEPEYQPQPQAAVMIQNQRATGIYDEPVIVDSMAVDDTRPIVENELEFAGQRPPSTAEPVVVDLTENNNAGKDITWAAASGPNVQSMAGYSYATNEETIEMVDIVPQEHNVENGKPFKGAHVEEDPEFFFKAKSITNMDSYFTCACLGLIANLIFGAVALAFVQKGRKAETPHEAKEKGCRAVLFAILGLLVSIGILLAVGFTRDPIWTLPGTNSTMIDN